MLTKRDKPKVVLDTNIVISALIAREGAPARIFEKLILGEIENYTNRGIIRELKEVLKRQEITKRTTRKARHFVLRHYLRNSTRIKVKSQVQVTEHKADNQFIETALDANAKHIITGDQHLLKLKEFKGIKIVKAKEFLERTNKSGCNYWKNII